jgi:transcriptional regulator with XRE-family HTH domain
MRLSEKTSDVEILAELGARLESARLRRDWTQARLAREAGIGVRTLKRLEAGEGGTLTTLVRVLRVLGLMDGVDLALPDAGPGPVEQAERGRGRRRASGRGAEPPPGSGGWRWGDGR